MKTFDNKTPIEAVDDGSGTYMFTTDHYAEVDKKDAEIKRLRDALAMAFGYIKVNLEQDDPDRVEITTKEYQEIETALAGKESVE